MRSWRPFCCGWPGLMRSIAMPRRSHQTESLERLNRVLGLAKGTPLSERITAGRSRSRNSRSKAVTVRSSRVDSRPSHRSRKREAWSVTVDQKLQHVVMPLTAEPAACRVGIVGAARALHRVELEMQLAGEPADDLVLHRLPIGARALDPP